MPIRRRQCDDSRDAHRAGCKRRITTRERDQQWRCCSLGRVHFLRQLQVARQMRKHADEAAQSRDDHDEPQCTNR